MPSGNGHVGVQTGYRRPQGASRVFDCYTVVFHQASIDKLSKNNGRETDLQAWCKRIVDYMVVRVPGMKAFLK